MSHALGLKGLALEDVCRNEKRTPTLGRITSIPNETAPITSTGVFAPSLACMRNIKTVRTAQVDSETVMHYVQSNRGRVITLTNVDLISRLHYVTSHFAEVRVNAPTVTFDETYR